MSRRSKPVNESIHEANVRRKLEKVCNHATRSDKTAWNRKMDNMVSLLAKLRPIEDQIVELTSQKMPIFDQVQVLRESMVAECIHPHQHLVLLEGVDDVVLCKFCNKRIVMK